MRQVEDVDSAGEAAASAGFMLNIEFDNQKDPDSTVITVSGQDQTDLLSQLTGAFNSLELIVASANIATTDDGQVLDVFRVTDDQEKARLKNATLLGQPFRLAFKIFSSSMRCT